MPTTAPTSVSRYIDTKPTHRYSPVPANTSATNSRAVLRRRPRKSVNLRQPLMSHFRFSSAFLLDMRRSTQSKANVPQPEGDGPHSFFDLVQAFTSILPGRDSVASWPPSAA